MRPSNRRERDANTYNNSQVMTPTTKLRQIRKVRAARQLKKLARHSLTTRHYPNLIEYAVVQLDDRDARLGAIGEIGFPNGGIDGQAMIAAAKAELKLLYAAWGRLSQKQQIILSRRLLRKNLNRNT